MDIVSNGWALSTGLHISVVLFAVFGMPEIDRKRPTPPPSIAIEFVQIAVETRSVETEEKFEKLGEIDNVVERAEQNVARAEKQELNTDDAAALPKLSKAKPKAKPEDLVRKRISQTIVPKSKPKAPSRMRSKRIAAMLDKSLKQEEDQAKKAAEDKLKRTEDLKQKLERARMANLKGQIATASLKDALSEKLAGCWSFPRGAKGVDEMQVTVRIWLTTEGKLARQPQFLDAGNLDDPSRAYYRTFAESARRAVKLCEPYDEAIQVIKAGGRYIDFVFDGAEFSGG